MGTCQKWEMSKTSLLSPHFLAQNTSKSEPPENKTQKLLSITIKRRLLISRHSSEIYCNQGHAHRYDQENFHIAAHNNHLTNLFSNHFALQKSPSFMIPTMNSCWSPESDAHSNLSSPFETTRWWASTSSNNWSSLETASNMIQLQTTKFMSSPWSWTEFELTTQINDHGSMSTISS